MKEKYISLVILIITTIYGYGQASITCPDDVVETCPYNVPFISPLAYTNFNTIILQTWTLSGATTGSSPAIGINDASLEVFQAGVTTVTYYVEDDLGNNATCSFTVTITDNIEPRLNCPENMVTKNDPGMCSAVIYDLGHFSSWDNCSGSFVKLINGLPPGSAFPVGTTTETFTLTDAAGNSTSCTFDITVIDMEDPTVSCSGDIIVTTDIGQCTAAITVPLPVATDNCSIVSVTNDYNNTANASDTYPLGTTTVTFTATDSANRTATCSFDVTVVNAQPPVITLLGANSITIETCDIYDEFGATASDTCLGDISSSIVIDDSAVDTSKVGTYIVTYNVFGAAQVTRTVNVVDTTKPTLTLVGPNPLTIGDCATFTELGAVANDPCFGDISSSIVINNTSVNSGILGSYTVTYDVMDASGNSATQIIRTVNVIDVNVPEIILIGDNPQIIEACTPYAELSATAIDPCFGTDISGSLVVDSSAVNIGVPGFYDVTYNVTDAFGNSAIEVVRTVNVVDTTINASAGSDFINSSCTDTTISLAANLMSGSSTGLWSVTSSQTTGFSFSDPTSPTATFVGDVGETYELTWFIYNPCGVSSDTLTVTFIGCNALDFDGVDDNITFKDNYNFSSDFSIEVWMKPDITNNNIQTIISKRESNNQTSGYDLRIVNNYISFNWNNGQSLTSPYQIITNIWHHVAVTFGNGIYRLYIDGIEANNVSGVVPSSNAFDCIVGAMDQTINPPFKPHNYFDGGMDELRIWNVALSSDQIHKMMNQEIEDNAGNVNGSIIPLDIVGLTWNNLYGYYRMNQSDDISSGRLLSNSNNDIKGRLRYITTFQSETAPLPYLSKANGIWTDASTWLFGSVQTIPNSLGVDGATPIDWNIVRTSHNISSGNNNITLLGLLVDTNTLSIEDTDPLDGHSLRITNYLKLDGTLDLVGESQLLQDTGSIVDTNGLGVLERDQQGTSNLYNYNYWGSPVSTNGLNFTIKGVLHDGTNPLNPKNLQWTNNYNADAGTSPITLSRRWIYSYENNPVNSYADWRYLGENGLLNVGLGFTMKGSGTLTSDQNYVFVGKPNNGTINSPITANYEALVGNPYPSAIDANEFILDNSSSTQGALYFWEHYASNTTHVLRDYQGGYAVYSLSGGNAAVSPPGVSGLGTPLKIPERYIPVGQGFFVEANTSGGNVVFENDQRVFVKESVTGAANNGSVFMKSVKAKNTDSEVAKSEDLIKRIRIDFKSPEGAIRHLLLGFVPNNLASDGFDYGYDAIVNETLPNDMLWMIEDEKYVIQGVGDFDKTKKYPFGVFLSQSGTIHISLENLENFTFPIDVYVYDALLGAYFKIDFLNGYLTNLDADDYTNRFYITFMNEEQSLTVQDPELQQIVVNYLNDTNEIFIKSPLSLDVKKVYLINMLGQRIKSWNSKNTILSHDMRIPVKNLSEGNYIIKVETTLGTVNRKIIVKQ